MSSIFTKIINGEIPCHKIAENEHFFAFLDIMPLVPGHVLVIPKKETDFIFDIEDTELGAMMVFAKKIAQAQKKAIACKRIAVTVIGLEVPHAHIHLLPINEMGDTNFTKPKMSPNSDELKEIAEQIKAQLQY
jgi:histidine triad (HIT) family protein